jgi:hypothetical protein
LTTVNYREIPPVKLTSSGKLTEIAGWALGRWGGSGGSDRSCWRGHSRLREDVWGNVARARKSSLLPAVGERYDLGKRNMPTLKIIRTIIFLLNIFSPQNQNNSYETKNYTISHSFLT